PSGPLDLARGSAPRCIPILRRQLADLRGELVEALSRRGERERHRFEPLGRSARRSARWCQPAKMWGPASDRLSRRAAVGLPSNATKKTDKKINRAASDGKGYECREPQPDTPDQVPDECAK